MNHFEEHLILCVCHVSFDICYTFVVFDVLSIKYVLLGFLLVQFLDSCLTNICAKVIKPPFVCDTLKVCERMLLIISKK